MKVYTNNLLDLRNLILNIDDLKKHSSKLNEIEREITIFHSKIINNVILRYQDED